VAGSAAGSELDSLLVTRIADLTSYQNEGYARQYADFVRSVREAEAARTPGETGVTEAVARYLYKLMAYKDEYEVARLALEPAFGQDIATTFGAGSKVSYRLHPPVLRALGMRRKIALGPWFRVVFRGLRTMRWLRGTPADVFGYSQLRRLERQLIGEYRDSVTGALAQLRPGNHELVVRIAALPDLIRGYEQIKLGNVARYRRELASLAAELSRPEAVASVSGRDREDAD
jgi:indolepyruvate ferredoxin oxidoreductase